MATPDNGYFFEKLKVYTLKIKKTSCFEFISKTLKILSKEIICCSLQYNFIIIFYNEDSFEQSINQQMLVLMNPLPRALKF